MKIVGVCPMQANSQIKTEPTPWAAAICHPLPLAAALFLAVNDHWLKGSGFIPAWLTGKLSDFFGLFFFPALCFSTVAGLFACLDRPLKHPFFLNTSIVLLVGFGFVAANLWPTFNDYLAVCWMHKAMDPTDLVALPALVLSWLWIKRCPGDR
jgi:hypothetical protein